MYALFFGRGNLKKFLSAFFRLRIAVLKSFILIKGGGRGLTRGEENDFYSDYQYFYLNNVFVLKKGEVLREMLH